MPPVEHDRLPASLLDRFGDDRADAIVALLLARLYPQDKTLNAGGLRRTLDPPASAAKEPPPQAPRTLTSASPIPPLLQRLLDQQSSSGLPPAYLPKHDASDDASDDDGDAS